MSFSVDTEALTNAAAQVAGSASDFEQAGSLLNGLPASCAQTPASGACDALASKAETLLGDYGAAATSLANAMTEAAAAYTIADASVI